MIRFDGYYKSEPIPYQERKEFSPDYSIQAYLFQDDGYVNIITKWDKNKDNFLCNKEDFLHEKSLVKYVYKNNKYFYLHRDISKPWEEKFYYDRISDEEFIQRQSGKSIKFVPWKE